MAERFVYILQSVNNLKTYTGETSDVDKRLEEHNHGSNSYTRKYKPWKVILVEKFNNRSDALKREKYYKSHAGRKQIKKLIDPR